VTEQLPDNNESGRQSVVYAERSRHCAITSISVGPSQQWRSSCVCTALLCAPISFTNCATPTFNHSALSSSSCVACTTRGA